MDQLLDILIYSRSSAVVMSVRLLPPDGKHQSDRRQVGLAGDQEASMLSISLLPNLSDILFNCNCLLEPSYIRSP